MRSAASRSLPKSLLRVAPCFFPHTTPQFWQLRRLQTAGVTGVGEKGGPVEDSIETHPDFQAKPVSTTDDAEDEEVKAIKQDILDTIRTESVVIFIKGSPEAPVCGFSKRVVDVLDALAVEYTSFDVLAHPTVRSYVKEVSQWPTIPQLFIKGEFFGGNDIIFECVKNGQLQMALERAGVKYRPIKM